MRRVRGARCVALDLGRHVAWILALLAWLLIHPADVVAQGGFPPATGTPGVAGELRTVEGRVLSGSASAERPVTGQVVVLHRISADSSGPVDSVRTSPAGTYRFRYRLDGPRSMYIVSAQYSGVAYFTTPLRDRAVTSPDADIAVYDTTSVAFPLAVRSRHVVIAPATDGVRRVVDVFEVANDSNRTLVPGASAGTWRVVLPEEARELGSSGGDLPPDAFRFMPGSAELIVPFPPGSRQVVLTYSIPSRGRVAIPITAPVANLEVLLEGDGGAVSGAGLAAEEPVSMEGRTFRRYTTSQVVSGASFTVGGPGVLAGNASRLALLAVAVAAVALGVVVGRRGGIAAPATEAPGTAEALAREIAALDHAHATPERQAGESGAWYRERRAVLFEELVKREEV